MSMISDSLSPSRASTSDYASTSQLSDVSPYSTLACQVRATNEWRNHLRDLLLDARTRFADVSWRCKNSEDDLGSEISHQSSIFSSAASVQDQESLIWAHKAILYARTSNIFQAKYLRLKAPSAQLGAEFASTSTISLPIVHIPDNTSAPSHSRPPSSLRSGPTNAHRMKGLRTNNPPSSFVARSNKTDRLSTDRNSESEVDENYPPGASKAAVKRTKSAVSIASSNISRPFSRNEVSGWRDRDLRQSGSCSSFEHSEVHGSDADSVISSTSTIRRPMIVHDILPAFFEASLEYIYTAEESAMEVFDFLHDDRKSSKDTAQERLEKLRQDFVFMWRSRLYSDIAIHLGEEDVGNIPDYTASVLSLPLNDEEDNGQQAVFYAHRMILASRSPYFAAQLLSPYADTHSDTIRLPSPPFTPAALHFTLGFMYTGTLFFSNRTFDLSTAFQLWLAGSYLGIETLQALVSSLIAEDFCHNFSCSPPCKTCIRRIPRTMSFVARADVSDFRLQQQVQDALAGTHFGSYWWKEVGNLDLESRQSIVSKVCSNMGERAEFHLTVLRQLSIVGSRVDLERNSQWVEALRSMCETVRLRLCSSISANFDLIVASKEWTSIAMEVGFSNDVLDNLLTTLLQNLSEAHAAKNYETLVGSILLREDWPPPPHIAQMCEEARSFVTSYIKKRWINIRLAGGFNVVQKWCLKELADEIDVSSEDLLLPQSDALTAARQQAMRTGGALPPWTSRRPSFKKQQPGSIVDGEREAGPIHLRAAVLNRNAARVSSSPFQPINSAVSSIGSITDASSIESGNTGPSGCTVGHRSALTQASRLNRMGDSPRKTNIVNNGSVRHPGTAMKLSSTSTTASTSRSGQADAQAFLNTDPAQVSGMAAALRMRKRSQDSAAGFAPSVTSSRSDSKAKQSDSAASTSRIRTPSTASNTSGRTTASKQGSVKGKRFGTHEHVYRKEVSRSTVQSNARRTQKDVSATLPMTAANPLHDAMQLDEVPTFSRPDPNSFGATTLSMGIPCIVAPSMRNGKAARFRATVKYIGPLLDEGDVHDLRNSLVIGVEVPLPLPDGVDESMYDFHDGSHNGVQYFAIGRAGGESKAVLAHKPEREERRLRLEQMLRRDTSDPTFESQNVIHTSNLEREYESEQRDRGTKRRKDSAGRVQDNVGPSSSLGLFIRPQEILWVVV